MLKGLGGAPLFLASLSLSPPLSSCLQQQWHYVWPPLCTFFYKKTQNPDPDWGNELLGLILLIAWEPALWNETLMLSVLCMVFYYYTQTHFHFGRETDNASVFFGD